MADPFATAFKWPYTIQVVSGAEGHYDGDARTWTAPTSTVTAITDGRVRDRRDLDQVAWRQRGDAGIIKEGDIELSTATVINRHDHVRIHDDASGTNYRVYRAEKHTGDSKWLAGKVAGVTESIDYVLRVVQSADGP